MSAPPIDGLPLRIRPVPVELVRLRMVATRYGLTQRRIPLSHRRAFVRRHTRLQEPPGLPGLRLYLADAVEPVWHALELVLSVDGPPIPFWAFAWAGGIGLARWLRANPASVAGQTVLDVATGSGLVAIAAAQVGAGRVTAVDIDPFAEAAVALNAQANHVHVACTTRDLLDEPPPAVDVLLVADTWYERDLAVRLLPWLRTAAAAGTLVVVADPGRRYLPAHGAGMDELATLEVRTTSTLETEQLARVGIFRLRPERTGAD